MLSRKRTLRQRVSRCRRGVTSFVSDYACGCEEFIDFPSFRYLGYQYLFRQASSLTLRIVQSFSWDVVELSQTVLNLDESGLWTGQSALRGELCTLLLCDRLYPMPDRSVLESMIRDQGRTTKVSLSSPDLTSIRDKYVLQ